MANNSLNIAILGAGVVGMTTARILQNAFKDAEITILAERFNQDTISCVAAGIFKPGSSFRGPTKDITNKWVANSWNYWEKILKSSEASQAGVVSLSTYIFSKENYHITRNHLIENLVPVYRAVDANELKICGEGWRYGSFFTSMKIGCERYLPWAERLFIENGGKIENRKIDSFTSLPRKYDLVFNCTGLGAKYLCNDHDLVPIRGQVIKAKVPWLKTAFYGDYDTYIIPGLDGVATLGGVRQYDSYNMSVSKYDTASIFERCCELLPALKNVEIVDHKVGLRPYRVPVRVEPELIDGVKVIHCYGHGGDGVMGAPGTALDAVEMGIDFLKLNTKSKI